MGGVLAAGSVLGPLGFLRIMNAAKTGIAPYEPLEKPGNVSGKKRATVVSKAKLSPLISLVGFNIDEPITFEPGQYAMLRVAPFEWRSYSIASVDNTRMTLLINTGTGGDGSIFIEGCQVGAETQVELPFGDFRLQNNDHRKVFIATGTGLAPFLPMFSMLKAKGNIDSAELLFGARLVQDSISRDMTPLPRTTLCASRDPSAENVFHGRVTDALKALTFEPATTDFYICGSPSMVTDCRAILTRAGAQNVYIESY
jgi:NAD(P)H-flavin reductase